MSVNELQALTQKFADAFDQREPPAHPGHAFRGRGSS
jgi:hypothetical protein